MRNLKKLDSEKKATYGAIFLVIVCFGFLVLFDVCGL